MIERAVRYALTSGYIVDSLGWACSYRLCRYDESGGGIWNAACRTDAGRILFRE